MDKKYQTEKQKQALREGLERAKNPESEEPIEPEAPEEVAPVTIPSEPEPKPESEPEPEEKEEEEPKKEKKQGWVGGHTLSKEPVG